MEAHVVVGSSYGDEGKGLMTDYLVRKHEADVVVRFNGGAQAGHTVVTPDNVRHVFSHFSSGTFAGADTYLSQFFVCNPILFMQEWQRLPVIPKVYVDPSAIVTTPWDMLINQEVENQRTQRHGSCGVGFNETIERSTDWSLCLRMESLGKEHNKLLKIIRKYVPRRCDALGLSDEAKERCMDEAYMQAFLEASQDMRDFVELAYPFQMQGKKLVFEGAQGLALDQDNKADFPHLTRSNTGTKNVAVLAPMMGVDLLEVVYVTRTYLTRHGAGPLPNEWQPEDIPASIVPDQTNVPHPFQGTLRYAPLETEDLLDRMYKDYDQLRAGKIASNVRIAVTCADHLDHEMTDMMGCKYISTGPKHTDIEDRGI